jgi:hypothetical protein
MYITIIFVCNFFYFPFFSFFFFISNLLGKHYNTNCAGILLLACSITIEFSLSITSSVTITLRSPYRQTVHEFSIVCEFHFIGSYGPIWVRICNLTILLVITPVFLYINKISIFKPLSWSYSILESFVISDSIRSLQDA